MTIVDERALEYLDDEGWGAPALIAAECCQYVGAGWVEERLLFLEYAGLVVRIHDDSFELTTAGRRYLDGELDAGLQPVPTVGRVLA